MKYAAFANVVAVTATLMTGTVSAGSVTSGNAGRFERPNCNSDASIAAYLSYETYYAKHPVFSPNYGEWNVPCAAGFPNKATGQPFPADYIKCSPNLLKYGGKKGKSQDRMFVCVQQVQCPAGAVNTIGSATEANKFAAAEDITTATNDLDDTNPNVDVNVIARQVCASTGSEPTDEGCAEVTKLLNQYVANLEVASDEAELEDYSSDYVNEVAQFDTWKSGAGKAFAKLCGKRYVAFSGTDDINDWITDLSAFPLLQYGTVFHAGFVGEFIKYVNDMSSVFPYVNEQYIYTGHSLGGAVTQIAAARHKKYKPTADVKYITIGGAAPAFNGQQTSPWYQIPGKNFVNSIHKCNWYGSDSYKKDIIPTLGAGILLHKNQLGVSQNEVGGWNWLGICQTGNPSFSLGQYGGAGVSIDEHDCWNYQKRINALYVANCGSSNTASVCNF